MAVNGLGSALFCWIKTQMRDDFTNDVKRSLSARVGHVCSNPECRAPTSGPHESSTRAVSIGVAAHISGAAPGGPRYNTEMSPQERSHTDNGIWLCENCAKLIDSNVGGFPANLLRAWRTVAEARAKEVLGRQTSEPPQSEDEKKVGMLRPWIGRQIKLTQINTGLAVARTGPERGHSFPDLLDCDDFGAKVGSSRGEVWSRRIPLANITLSFDDARQLLEIREGYD